MVVIAGIFVVACVMVLVLVVRRWLQPENINSTYIAWSDSKGYTMGYFLKNPIQFFEILLNTLWYESGKHIQQMLGSYLGWLDIEVPLVFVIGFLLLLLYVSIRKENEEQLITVGDRIWMLLVFVGVTGSCSDAFILDAISICCGSRCTGKIFPSGTCGWFACSSDKTDMCIKKCRSICCYVDGVFTDVCDNSNIPGSEQRIVQSMREEVGV